MGAFQSLPEHARSDRLRLLYGEAQQMRGDFEPALAAYAVLADRQDTLTAGLAWRYGLVHYLRGEPHSALEVFQRGALDPHPSTDNARLLAWTAAAQWTSGNAEACQDSAERALAAATAIGGDAALAAAHTALALDAKLRGDRPAADEHHEKALRAAEAARDTVQVTRIRANRASALVGEGRYLEALAEVRPAVELAQTNGYAAMLALALCNEASAHFHLGQLAEATACSNAPYHCCSGWGPARWRTRWWVSATFTHSGAVTTWPAPRTRRRCAPANLSTISRSRCRRSPDWPACWPPRTARRRSPWPNAPSNWSAARTRRPPDSRSAGWRWKSATAPGPWRWR